MQECAAHACCKLVLSLPLVLWLSSRRSVSPPPWLLSLSPLLPPLLSLLPLLPWLSLLSSCRCRCCCC